MGRLKTTESVNYYLKHGKGYASHLIFLQFKFEGQRLRYYLPIAVDPKKWSTAKQRVKDANARAADGRHTINDLLNTLAAVCIDAYHTETANGGATPELIKKALDTFMRRNETAQEVQAARPTFFDLYSRVISGEATIRGGQQKGKQRNATTLKAMGTTLNHLRDFEKAKRYLVDFDTITQDFYDKFTAYLKAKGISLNTRGRHIKDVKTVMADALHRTFEVDGKKHPYTTNREFMDFAVTKEDAEHVYLNWDEITQLYTFDLSDNKPLERVRDLFVFGCMVGLRYSDYSKVKPENIVDVDGEKFLYVRTQKTGEVVYIPCNPVVLDIFSKYASNRNQLPRTISGQKFNEYIKDAARLAGLTDTGRLLSSPDAALCDLISSHTARRSFATNYYLDGFPTIDLMRITGHKTERAFLTYIKVSKLKAAQRLAEHNRRKNWAVLVGHADVKLRVAS
jgi:integrase